MEIHCETQGIRLEKLPPKPARTRFRDQVSGVCFSPPQNEPCVLLSEYDPGFRSPETLPPAPSAEIILLPPPPPTPPSLPPSSSPYTALIDDTARANLSESRRVDFDMRQQAQKGGGGELEDRPHPRLPSQPVTTSPSCNLVPTRPRAGSRKAGQQPPNAQETGAKNKK